MSGLYFHRFGLREEPFRLTPDPRYFYRGEQYERAIAELLYGIEGKKGFMVLTGEVGTGKTTLCRTLLNTLDPAVRTALILNPSLTAEELIKSIVQDFGLPMPSLFPTKKDLVDTLNRFLLKIALDGGGAVLIVDEAQNLSRELLEELRLLTNLETEQEKLLQIILIGQPELADQLTSRDLRQLRQRVAVWARISALGREETAAYIMRRLQVAAETTPGVRFTRRAVKRIHDAGDGYPRTVNLLCDRILMLAYLEDTDLVTGRMVSRAAAEVVHKEIMAAGSHRWSLATAGAAALLLALIPSGVGRIDGSAKGPEPVMKELRVVREWNGSVPDVLSAYLAIQGYPYLGKEVRQWSINAARVGDIDLALTALDMQRQYGVRSAVIPLHHSLWLKAGVNGIVKSPDGSFSVVEPLWGKGDRWKVMDGGERETDGLEADTWDQALVLYRPLNGLEIPLAQGDKGAPVSALQAALSRLSVFKRSEVDGVYGRRTANAVMTLQRRWSLESTGSVDDGTAYYLSRFLEIRK